MGDACFDQFKEYGDVVFVTDCRCLNTARKDRAKNHLGSHPWNLAAVLASGKYRSWRVREYVKLYYLLTSTRMLNSADREQHCKAIVDFCNKGCHRSRCWGVIQAKILQRMGFNVKINMVCTKAMAFQCANPERESCDECRFEHPAVTELLNVATDEFFEVITLRDGRNVW